MISKENLKSLVLKRTEGTHSLREALLIYFKKLQDKFAFGFFWQVQTFCHFVYLVFRPLIISASFRVVFVPVKVTQNAVII